jgi:steroid 5-alpha reductase family enzyme
MTLLASNAVGILAIAVVLWLASVRLRDASIVDPWWSILFLFVGCNTALRTGLTGSKCLFLGLLSLWSLRLFTHLWLRARGKPEDPRYAAFRVKYGPERYWWVSLFQVFLLQGLLALAISAPVQVVLSAAAPDPISPSDWLGTAVFAIGFAFEAVADAQLQRFRRDPSRRGTVLDTGLWAWTRHPNYFGEALLWWGLWLHALDQPWGWATLPAPVLLTFLLVRVSGVAMLDDLLRRTKPRYADYIARTSAFLPRRPS